MNRLQHIWRLGIVVLVAVTGLSILMVPAIPGVWIYNRVALGIAFGSERAAREHITVWRITKPSTITFSNGRRIDVGMTPAVVSNVFHVAVAIPLVVAYILLIRRRGPQWLRATISEQLRGTRRDKSQGDV